MQPTGAAIPAGRGMQVLQAAPAAERGRSATRRRQRVEPIDQLDPDNVHDRESFLAFVRALVADREAAVEAEKRK